MATQILTQGNIASKIIIQRTFDMLLYLVPPIEELYDISIQINPPNTKEFDILISVVREFDNQLLQLKKVDTLSGFALTTKSNINENFSNLVFIDNNLTSIVDISSLLNVPHGSFESLKTVSPLEYQSLPVSDKFVILDCSQVSGIFKNEIIDGMLFMKFKHSFTTHPTNHDELKKFFNIDNLQFVSYVDGTNLPTNIDDYYASYYIGYLFIPHSMTLTFGIDGDDACEIEIDGNVICSWYGGHGFSNDPSKHSAQITLQAGWHRIIVRHEEITGGDGVKAYIYDSINSTWRLLTYQNIKSYFPGLKLKVPFYLTKEDIIQNLFLNPQFTLNESLEDFIENSSIILFKTTSENKELLENLPNIKTKVSYTLSVLSGIVEGSDTSLLQEGNMLSSTDGVSFKPDDSGNKPSIELIFSEPKQLTNIYMFIAPTFNYPYYDYSDKFLTLEFYTDDNNILKALPTFIDSKNSQNIKDFVYSNNQYMFKFIDQNQVTLLYLNSKIKIQKIRFYFEDSIGTFKLLLPTTKLDSIKLIDYPNKILTNVYEGALTGIPFENLNINLITKAKIPKQLALISEYIAFSKDETQYSFKLINLPIVYTATIK